MGLLGGGNSELPAGYLRAEFLESTGTQYIKVELPFTPNTRVVARAAMRTKNDNYVFSIMPVYTPADGYGLILSGAAPYPNTFAFNSSSQIYKNLNLVLNLPYVFEVDGHKMRFNGTDYPFPQEPSRTLDFFVLFAKTINQGADIYGRSIVIFDFEYFDETKLKLTPAVDSNGVPCMFDKVSKKPLYNSGSGAFVVGMTLEQARKLGRLPSPGGSLTVSLPTGYESDAGVANALETARANGWTLTVQTYESETATATFALRRIWVRRKADENGAYVDTAGTRWQVDWCVDMLTPDGSSPDHHGYELFRSVDAAVAYWELETYVDPAREEELLTETNTNNE